MNNQFIIKAYWARFESWILQHAPHLLALLNPGATQEDIHKLETIVGRKLPADFIAFYQVYNGQDENKDSAFNKPE